MSVYVGPPGMALSPTRRVIQIAAAPGMVGPVLYLLDDGGEVWERTGTGTHRIEALPDRDAPASGPSAIDVRGVGSAVMARRTALGLRLRDVAAQTGVSQATLSRLERGIGMADTTVLNRLLAWLTAPPR